MIKTAVIGASGFIGGHLLSAYRENFPDCIGTAFGSPAPGLTPFDIRAPNIDSLGLDETGHEAVLIASAKPNVDYCEREPAASQDVNVRGTLELLRQLSRTKMAVIFLSSDYVFDGQTGAYEDSTPQSPITEYGRQKATVEREIGELCDNYLVARLSKVIGSTKNDGTLLDEIAGRLCRREEVLAAHDQIFSPTLVQDVVRGVHTIQQQRTRGIVNLCSPQAWSRYELALAMAEALGRGSELVRKISLLDLPLAGTRPKNTSMVCKRLSNELSFRFTPVAEGIARVAANWKDTTDDG